MASVRTLVRLKRGGQYHPPGSTFHDLSEREVEDLGAAVERLDGICVPPASPVAAVEPLGLPPVPPSPAAVPEPPGEADSHGSRVEETACAIDLLDTCDFDADGRPKLGPLAEVLGFAPTTAELDLALAMRAEEGL